jgi:hypothetical protein
VKCVQYGYMSDGGDPGISGSEVSLHGRNGDVIERTPNYNNLALCVYLLIKVEEVWGDLKVGAESIE